MMIYKCDDADDVDYDDNDQDGYVDDDYNDERVACRGGHHSN